MIDKKNRERLFLDEAMSLSQYFPEGEIINSEQPDFIIINTNVFIGVEMVDYIRGQNQDDSAYRRNEILWQKVADATKLKYEYQHSDPLMILFHWYPHRYLRDSEIEELANEAAKAVIRNTSLSDYDSIQISSSDLGDGKLSLYVHTISVRRVNYINQVICSYAYAGLVSVIAGEIQVLINKKDKKVADYLKKCQEIWLLIVADGVRISSSIDISPNTLNTQFKSQFNRVLFYDRERKRVFDLQVSS